MDNCIFCKIAFDQILTEKVYDDDEVCAFNDLNPQAPTHVLIIPKKHIASIDKLESEDSYLIGKLTMVAQKIAKDRGLDSGYRLVMNCNEDGGQTVFHIHMHLMGGRTFGWPAG
ncbi:histidine triad nucleotide-binding protein [bacterium]|nr:histidine triad nucleotide-binding protein [bacterium]